MGVTIHRFIKSLDKIHNYALGNTGSKWNYIWFPDANHPYLSLTKIAFQVYSVHFESAIIKREIVSNDIEKLISKPGSIIYIGRHINRNLINLLKKANIIEKYQNHYNDLKFFVQNLENNLIKEDKEIDDIIKFDESTN